MAAVALYFLQAAQVAVPASASVLSGSCRATAHGAGQREPLYSEIEESTQKGVRNTHTDECQSVIERAGNCSALCTLRLQGSPKCSHK
jgi:hypothetical protein